MRPIAAWRGDRVQLLVRNRQRTRAIDVRFVRRIVGFLVRDCFGGERHELGVHLVDAPTMALLNEQFLGHAGPTDVVTFDYGEDTALAEAARVPPARKGAPHAAESCSLAGSRLVRDSRDGCPALRGDVFICVDVAVAQSRRFRTTWQKELVRYLIHGLLHLSGYDDIQPHDRREMKRAEDRLLRRVAQTFTLAELLATGQRSRRQHRPWRNSGAKHR